MIHLSSTNLTKGDWHDEHKIININRRVGAKPTST